MGAWIDLSKTIDTAPVSALQRRTTVLLVILAILDGFDAMMLGYAVPSIASDWEVGTAEFGVVLSASAAAMVFGSILFGSLSDRFGRRRVILAGTLLFSIFTLLTAFAVNHAGPDCAPDRHRSRPGRGDSESYCHGIGIHP